VAVLDPRSLARMYGMSRVGLGAVLALFPSAARPWTGVVARNPDAHGPLRVLGVRDALLGVAVLGTPEGSRHRRGALLLCAAADAADAVVTLADFVRTKRPGAALASLTAAGGAAIGLFTMSAADG
jgi:hypothetical protein